ncbi:MAG TPA: isoprenylcysteine carboxylmethyltransferase family protein [Solirubrobacteraceae bacterium]|nr:isoprenylcysteine carboxylmethyltransferase family protein [Solirubrobacteraceae bacterium]
MHSLRVAVEITWAVFWIGWLVSAFTARRSINRGRGMSGRGIAAVAVVVLVRGFRGGALEVHSLVLGLIGAALLVAGLALAIWARVILGRNWGMPMTERIEPELVTAGPYRLIRHPIYTGLLLALVGSSLVTNLIGLGIAVILGVYFVYSATVEERNLTATFPQAYPEYKAHTKMLIPYLL